MYSNIRRNYPHGVTRGQIVFAFIFAQAKKDQKNIFLHSEEGKMYDFLTFE